MKKFLLALGLLLNLAAPASAQNTTCSDRPAGDSSNACANTRFVQNTSNSPVNVVSLGAKCDWNGTTGTDDHVVIQNAVNTYKNVLIPAQCYIGTSTITFGNLAFSTLTGINSEWSALIQASTNLPTVSVVASTTGLKIQHLGITKPSTVTALAGAIGILFNGFNDLPVLDDVEVQRHYNGLSLSSTGYGKLQNSYIHANTSDGIIFQNPAILNDYQWNIDTTLSESNGGWGALVVTGSNVVLGPKSSQGTWTNVFTFNNTSGGVKFLGNATVPIQGIRLNSPFLGSDKGPELVLDTYNTSIGSHIITNPYLEFNTSGTCMQITANNNGGISIVNPAFSTCFTSGLLNAANNVFITGGFITAANTFSIVNSGVIDVLHTDLLGSTSGPVSNTGTYTGHLNLPASANTAFTVPEGGTGLSSGTSGGVPYFNSGTTIASSAALGAGLLVNGGGAGVAPSTFTLGGDCTFATPNITCTKTSGVANRIRLSANLSMFVRTDGSNANCSGLVNAADPGSGTIPRACGVATIQKAYDILADGYDVAGLVATINVANGTYTTPLLTAKCVTGQNGPAGVLIIGNATPSNVIWSTTSADTISLGASTAGAGTNGCTQLTIGGMRLQTTTSGNAINVAGGGVGITIGTPGFPVDFGASAQNHIVTNHSAWAIAGTNNSISGSAVVAHVAALSGSQAALHNTTLTCTGSPVFGFFAYSEGAGSNVFLSGMTFSGCGTATGPRYFASKFGAITTLGSATYLPGNATGAISFFGQYVGTTGTTSGDALIATSITSPIYTTTTTLTFQSNGSTFAGGVTTGQQWFLGANATPATGALLSLNQNTGSPAASTFGTINLHVIGADAASPSVTIDTYGAGQGIMEARYAGGTQASKTAAGGATTTFSFLSRGWDTAAYGAFAAIDFITGTNTLSPTEHNGSVRIRTVPSGATALAEAGRFHGSGGFSVGTTTDPTIGKISALNGYIANGLAGITTVCTIAVGNVLTFTLGILTAKGGVAGCT